MIDKKKLALMRAAKTSAEAKHGLPKGEGHKPKPITLPKMPWNESPDDVSSMGESNGGFTSMSGGRLRSGSSRAASSGWVGRARRYPTPKTRACSRSTGAQTRCMNT